MVHKMSRDIPTRINADRVYLRSYQPGDGNLLFQISRRNRDHLAQYESENALLSINTSEEANTLARDLSAEWAARNHFFLGVFKRDSDEFVAQVYVGPVDWDHLEFVIGYIADVEHQGVGYVTEAVNASLDWLFNDIGARHVRLSCADTNERSWRVAERCGFRREEHIPKNKHLPDGTIVGTYLYAMSLEEYLA